MLANLPNILTLSRIVIIPAFVAAFYLPGHWVNWTSFILFALAGVTDYFDGYLARAYHTTSRLGQFLDPVADKLLVATALLMMAAHDTIGGWSILPAIVILCREILVAGLREFLAELQVIVPVSRLAKWKTTMQMIALGTLLLAGAVQPYLPAHELGMILLWAAAILTIYTGYDYLRAGIVHMTGPDSADQPREQSDPTATRRPTPPRHSPGNA